MDELGRLNGEEANHVVLLQYIFLSSHLKTLITCHFYAIVTKCGSFSILLLNVTFFIKKKISLLLQLKIRYFKVNYLFAQ